MYFKSKQSGFSKRIYLSKDYEWFIKTKHQSYLDTKQLRAIIKNYFFATSNGQCTEFENASTSQTQIKEQEFNVENQNMSSETI